MAINPINFIYCRKSLLRYHTKICYFTRLKYFFITKNIYFWFS
jgi:hypothetical protein